MVPSRGFACDIVSGSSPPCYRALNVTRCHQTWRPKPPCVDVEFAVSIVVDAVATSPTAFFRYPTLNAIVGHEITEASFWRKAVGTALDEKVGFLAHHPESGRSASGPE